MSITTFDVTSPGTSQSLSINPLVLSTYPKIHGLVGAQFGDLEYDVGKSVRWLDFFTDDIFVVDINTGEQRYWVINWSESFPGSEHTVTGRNFFYSTAEAATWRKEQFQWADATFAYDANDWCLFVDAHEGLSIDNRVLPADYLTAPFGSWIFREIERAGSGDRVILPFFAYLKNSDLQNIVYGTPANAAGFSPQQAVSVPWYLPSQGLLRLLKVSALRNPAFNWYDIDRLQAPTAGVQVQIISYAYAHWQALDIPAGQTAVPPLDVTTDLGWQMRKMFHNVRPLPGVPDTDPWKDPSTDPTTYPGPWCVDTTSSLDATIATTIEENGHTAPAAQCAAIRTPLYDQVIRLNLRDGLWYEYGVSGNIPLDWDPTNQVWVPRYDPTAWDKYGVGADQNPPVDPSPVSLYLDGASGSYTRTQDANYFDFQSTFTLIAVVQLRTYRNVRQCLASKWGAAGQRSWMWTIEANGDSMVTISRDGTASVTFTMPSATLTIPDNVPVAIGVNFFTTGDVSPVDQVRFWQWNGTAWGQIGNVVTQPNPNDLTIFNSTTEVEVGGATSGTTLNAFGWFRFVSIATGGDPLQFGTGTEVARMRGDTTLNPGYDRYGNLWSNHGGWAYEDMTGTVPNPSGWFR